MTGGKHLQMPIPHAGQQAILKAAKRHNWLVVGRRWLKTTLAAHVSILSALEGARIIWGAPTYDQVRVAYNFIERIVYSIARSNSTRMEMKFVGSNVAAIGYFG